MSTETKLPIATFTTKDFAMVGTAEEFISALHDRSLAPAKDDQQFMKELAHRMLVGAGHRIRTTSANDFVDDLAKAGEVVIGPVPGE